MSEPATPDAARPYSADDSLPPVEPPSAGFLLQLFVIPAIIVGLIVALYWGVNRLAHGQADPRDSIAKIRRKNSGSWQAASTLADQLRNPHNNQARRDPLLAAELGKVLEEELANKPEEQSIVLRYFLCKCLGEFETPEGLPALLKAAQPTSTQEEIQVRLAALEGIAVLASKMKTAGGLRDPQLAITALAAVDDPTPAVRNRAAIVLGVLDDPDGKLTARLERMLEDSNPDTRFNAAAYLSRLGKVETLDVLAEMLEPDAKALEAEEESLREQKRLQIVVYGLRSIHELAALKPDADLSAVRPVIERLRSDPSVAIRKEAELVAQTLPKPSGEPKTPAPQSK